MRGGQASFEKTFIARHRASRERGAVVLTRELGKKGVFFFLCAVGGKNTDEGFFVFFVFDLLPLTLHPPFNGIPGQKK